MNTKKIEELENIIKQAQEQKDELKKFIKQAQKQLKKELEKEDKTPKSQYPNDGDIVWIINRVGKVDFEYWNDSFTVMFDLGMIFLTKEDAEFERERSKVIKELELFKEPEYRKWVGNDHYYIYYRISYNTFKGCVAIGSACSSKGNDIYFATKEDAQKAIDYVGEERVEKFYLRVEE